MSYAQFEVSQEDADDGVERARRVYERANGALRLSGDKEERVLLLEAWKQLEMSHGTEEHLQILQAKMPNRIKKRQRIFGPDGVRI